MDLQHMETLETMKKKIESMNKFHQVEILKILSKNLCKINENKSGVYINLSFLPPDTIKQLNEYINYTKDQQESLNTMEYQKEDYKNTFFIEKDNKEEIALSYNN
jgi:hypothetical protein